MLQQLHEGEILQGKDAFGRMSYMEVKRHNQPGLHFQTRQGNIIPISLETASRGERIITTGDGKSELKSVEHFAGLMWLGANSLVLSCEHEAGQSSGHWLPTDGSGLPYWETIRPLMQTKLADLEWVHVKKGGRAIIGRRLVTIEPIEYDGLEIWVEIDYPEIGYHSRLFILPDDQDLIETKLLPSKSQGILQPNMSWKESYDFITKAHQKDPLQWPRPEIMNWPHIMLGNGMSVEEIANEFILHRLYDILAALALLGNGKRVACRLISKLGGHGLDLDACREVVLV